MCECERGSMRVCLFMCGSVSVYVWECVRARTRVYPRRVCSQRVAGVFANRVNNLLNREHLVCMFAQFP